MKRILQWVLPIAVIMVLLGFAAAGVSTILGIWWLGPAIVFGVLLVGLAFAKFLSWLYT